MSTEIKKWTSDNLPKGYPTKCGRRILNNVIEDLSEELVHKTINDNKDLYNKTWANRIITFIQLGHGELQRKNNFLMLIANILGLLIALIAIYLSVISLLTTSNWESQQIQALDEQKQIQQQIFEKIKNYSQLK